MTVFSFGAGQESIYLLHRFFKEPDFFNKWVKGPLIVAGSDTGDEHKHTHLAIAMIRQLCEANGFEFYWITPDMGFHPKTWQSLQQQYDKNSGVGSAAFIQTCTDNLKIKVINNFIEQWLKDKYGYTGKNKKAYHQYFDAHGQQQIRLILGFAAGEESRTSKGNTLDPKWKVRTMLRCFPLIEEGINRQKCIDYNEANIEMRIYPSNCRRCFYQSDQEVLWLYRNEPEVFWDWVRQEKNKLAKWEGKTTKNLGVYNGMTLEQKLEKAIDKYGHWTNEELDEYKYSHGHCIKSKY